MSTLPISDPGLPRSGLSMSSHRQPRILFVTIDGTLAGSVCCSRKTVVSELPSLISHQENVVRIASNGVGSGIGFSSRYISALGGWGTRKNVIEAYKNLANHYRPGDKIILCGYSRGAWAVRYLAQLIHAAGLPQNGDQRLFHHLYEADDSILDPVGVAEMIKDLGEYELWPSVPIEALCCFDTVGSLGVPLFGLARPFSLFRPQKTSDIISAVAPNVKHAFHCLSLHETREPYSPTLMSGPNVRQVFFLGTHSDMGWIGEDETLVTAPLAWMIQQLDTHIGINFDHTRLAARFPAYRPLTALGSSPSINSNLTIAGDDKESKWWQRPFVRHTPFLLAIIGKKPRQPGCAPALPCRHRPGPDTTIIKLDDATTLDMITQKNNTLPTPRVQVHIGARLRTSGGALDSVPGYVLAAPVNAPPHWARLNRTMKEKRMVSHGGAGRMKRQCNVIWGRRRHSRPVGLLISSSWSWGRATSHSVLSDQLSEAPVGPLEARLLGIPGASSALLKA
ncbi:hypothetical protein F5X68DRAFT_197346 [Plectosphaerella plurivora]|uniref:T6SS Phospholipase effector Tle1-like catalytic domain-containing protein n=1 Tax=Plectosphaerella plurivora TaxID=936078 RepID=A0A9P8VN08_9PEZI|nr:hypothetical protein F5X68DRAFT_197346 [Plectosphaerella plurivora]